MKRKLIILLPVLILMSAAIHAATAESTDYADLLLAVDYGEGVTWVVGHKSPDADAVGSAIAYAGLLQSLGISAKPAAAGKVNQETGYALGFFGLDLPEILSDAEGKQFVLVDHSEYSQALDGMRGARIVGIVDHHGIGDVRATERIPVWSLPAGAAASIVYKAYLECGVEIPRDTARVILMAILSDTKGMTSNVTVLDREAYEALLPISEIGDPEVLYAGMKTARLSYTGMTVSEIFHDDYKEYLAGEYTFSVGNVFTDTEENALALAEKITAEFPALYASNHMDMLFCMISTDDTTWIVWYGEDADKAILESFPDYDGSGVLVFTPKVSRKEHVVPPLTAALEKWSAETP